MGGFKHLTPLLHPPPQHDWKLYMDLDTKSMDTLQWNLQQEVYGHTAVEPAARSVAMGQGRVGLCFSSAADKIICTNRNASKSIKL